MGSSDTCLLLFVAPSRSVEAEQVVGQADQLPFSSGFIEGLQQELTKAPTLFNLPKHGLYNLTPPFVDRPAFRTGQFRPQRVDTRNAIGIIAASQPAPFLALRHRTGIRSGGSCLLIFLRPAIGFHIEVDSADVRRPHLHRYRR